MRIYLYLNLNADDDESTKLFKIVRNPNGKRSEKF